jgi:shikimate kinase
MPRITLIGYRGTGKSTVASLLADTLGCGWRDADLLLEEKLGCSIASLVRARGEAVFRDEESVVLAECLDHVTGVLSTGGGVVLRAENRALLHRLGRPVVWLTASAEVVRRRLAADPTTADRRPALAVPATGSLVSRGDPLAEVATTLETRAPLYRECADVCVDTSIATPAAVTAQIVAWLESDWATRLDRLSPGDGPHDHQSPGGMP